VSRRAERVDRLAERHEARHAERVDETLRALERAARADATDRAAGWAYVRALDRAGDVVGAWRERCRLARGGDLSAWDELTWCPRGVRTEPRVTARVRLERLGGIVGGGGSNTVVLVEGEDIVALDARTLEQRWRCAAIDAAWLGPCLALLRDDEVVLLRADEGRALTSVPLGVRGHRLHGAADRVLVHHGADPASSVTIDLGPAPRVDPRPAGVGLGAFALAGDGVLWSAPSRPEAASEAPELFAVSARDPARRRPLPGFDVHCADARSALVGWAPPSPHEELGFHDWALIDLATADVAWVWSRGPRGCVHEFALHAEEVFVASTEASRNLVLEARSRRSGTLRWSVPLLSEPVSPAWLGVTADVILVKVCAEELGSSASLVAFDRATGRQLWSIARPIIAGFAALDGALVVACKEAAGRLVLERLEA
jgi:hypothetical protein